MRTTSTTKYIKLAPSVTQCVGILLWQSGRLTLIPSMAKLSIYALDFGYSGHFKNIVLAVISSCHYPLLYQLFLFDCLYWYIISLPYKQLVGNPCPDSIFPLIYHEFLSPLQSPIISTSNIISDLTTSNLFYYYYCSNSGDHHLLILGVAS